MILPTIRQVQIIADLLKTASIPGNVHPDDLSEPWRGYFQWCLAWIQEDVATAEPHLLDTDFYQAFAPSSRDFITHYQRIRAAIQSPITYPSADIGLADIGDLQWLWKDWLLRGLPSLLAALPGIGKSYLALDLARRIISGDRFPDGAPAEEPGPVLYVDAENTPAIHKKRLSVWPQAYLQQLFFMLPAPGRYIINLDDLADRERLCDMAWKMRPVLIIIDSYGSCTLKGENNKEDVQELLAFLNQLAKHFSCSVLVIHHLRKAANIHDLSFVPVTIDSVRGSSHIAAMARHIWGLHYVPSGPQPDPNDPRRLWVMKTNVGAPPCPLGVTFNPHPDHAEVAQLTYGEAPQPYKEPTRVTECAAWILAQITHAGEPLRPADLIQRAKAEGYYRSLIYRARRHLGARLTDTHEPQHPQNAWALSESTKENASDDE